MRWVAPSAFACSSFFSLLAVAMIDAAPASFATCTAALPMPEPAAWISTRLPRLQEAAVDEHVPGGAEGDLRRGRVLEAHVRGQGVEVGDRHRDVLGVAARDVEAEVAFLDAQVVAPGEAQLALAARNAAGDPHAVALLEICGVAVQAGDFAGEFAAQDVRERQRNARGARAVVEVDVVDAHRAHAHQRLAGLRRGLGGFLVDQDFRTAELVEPRDLHEDVLFRISGEILRLRYWPSFKSPWNLPSATITLPRSTVTDGQAPTSLPSHGE